MTFEVAEESSGSVFLSFSPSSSPSLAAPLFTFVPPCSNLSSSYSLLMHIAVSEAPFLAPSPLPFVVVIDTGGPPLPLPLSLVLL